ncbi:MAG TPA: PspA/IM30 family protein [Chloroflexia bacterium]|nr:PspA/IM30 family protein [Chloroflexia bacterium]
MGILDRINMIVRSNVNSILDKSSNPEADLNYFMLQMQDGIRQSEKEIQESVVRQKMLEMNAADLRRKAQEWDTKAQTAVRANRDDLATEALRQKMAVEQEAEQLESQARDQQTATTQLRGQMEELKKKYSETERNKGNLIAQYNMLKFGEKVMGTKDPATGLPNSDYNRMQQKIMAEQVRAEMDEQQYRAAAAEAELDHLQKEASLDDELAALKQRMGANKPKDQAQNQAPKSGDDKPYDEK